MSNTSAEKDKLGIFLVILIFLYWTPRLVIHCVRKRRRRLGLDPPPRRDDDPNQGGLPTRQRTEAEILKQREERKDFVMKSVVIKRIISSATKAYAGTDEIFIEDINEGVGNANATHATNSFKKRSNSIEDGKDTITNTIAPQDPPSFAPSASSPISSRKLSLDSSEDAEDDLGSDDDDDEELNMTGSYDPKMCSICLDTFEENDQICLSQNKECPHIFHLECMTDWLMKHSNCPLCRLEFIDDPKGNTEQRRRERRRRRRRMLEEQRAEGGVTTAENGTVDGTTNGGAEGGGTGTGTGTGNAGGARNANSVTSPRSERSATSITSGGPSPRSERSDATSVSIATPLASDRSGEADEEVGRA